VLAKLWLFCDPGAGFYWFIQSAKRGGENRDTGWEKPWPSIRACNRYRLIHN